MKIAALLVGPLEPAASVLRNGPLRRVQLALAATALTTPAYGVALSIYAYREGGLSLVAVVGIVTFLPAGILAPALSVLADRGRRERVLSAALLVRGSTLAASATCIFVDAPPASVLAFAALSSIAARVVRPAQAALVPSLARDDNELSATNALAATIDEVGTVVGPAIAGGMLFFAGPEPMLAVAAVAALGASLLVRGLPTSAPPERVPGTALARELVAGFATIAGNRTLHMPVLLLTAQTAAYGAVGILMVPLAIELLALGNAGLGLLEVALGVGGVVGGILAIAVAGESRLGACLGIGAVLWGTSVALVGLYPAPVAALVIFVAIGATGILVDVPAYTMIQRATPSAVLGRTFGALEGLGVVGTALGAGLAPVLVTTIGLRGTFLAIGTAIIVPAMLGWRTLQAIPSGSEPNTEPAQAPLANR